MPEKIYCYCCRVHHAKDEMQHFKTRHGLRWRCRRSIEAAAREIENRDAFGRMQTEFNRMDTKAREERFPVTIIERRLLRQA